MLNRFGTSFVRFGTGTKPVIFRPSENIQNLNRNQKKWFQTERNRFETSFVFENTMLNLFGTSFVQFGTGNEPVIFRPLENPTIYFGLGFIYCTNRTSEI